MTVDRLPREDWEVTATALHGRISSLETAVSDIASSLRTLAAKLDDRGRIQWPALAFALSFIVSVGGLVYWPVVQTQQRLETGITKLGEGAVGKEDFLLIVNNIKERRDDAQRVNEARFVRIEKDVDGAQAAIVPRSELTEKWEAQRQHDIDLQRQIDEARSQLRDLYSPRDAIANIERKLDELDRRTATVPKG